MSRDLRRSDKVNHICYVRVPVTTIVRLNIFHAAWLHRMPAVFGPWSCYPRIPPGCAVWAKYQPPPKPSLTSRYLLYMISLPIFCLRLLTLIPNKALENTFFYRIISLFSSRRSFWRMLIVTCIKTMSLFGDVRTYPSWIPKTTCTTTRHNPQKTDQSDPTNLAGELLSILVYGDDILSSNFSAKSSTHAAWPWLLNRPQMPWPVFDADVSMKNWRKMVIWLPNIWRFKDCKNGCYLD